MVLNEITLFLQLKKICKKIAFLKNYIPKKSHYSCQLYSLYFTKKWSQISYKKFQLTKRDTRLMSQIHSFSYLKQQKLRKSVLELAQLSDLQLLPILFTFAALLKTISLLLVGLFRSQTTS